MRKVLWSSGLPGPIWIKEQTGVRLWTKEWATTMSLLADKYGTKNRRRRALLDTPFTDSNSIDCKASSFYRSQTLIGGHFGLRT